MKTTETAFPIEQVREHFPALKRTYNGKEVAYFDGPGGSQVVKSAIEAISAYMELGGANLHGAFPSSWETEAIITEAKEAAGRMPETEQRSVGIISFYGEQVKRLQRMVDQELRLPHLTLRTGTVDRFQGSEMDIILLSMVRNNKQERGDIGFARDYRRLNVALSRARQLLVLVGSSEMFTKRAKREETRRMYRHVLETVEEKGGWVRKG